MKTALWINLLLGTMLSSCMSTGCRWTDAADRVAKYSNPKVKASAGLFGTSLEIGTDFEGAVAHVGWDDETKQWVINDLTIASKPQEVIDAESRRVPPEVFRAIREAEYSAKVQQTQIISDAASSLVGSIASAVQLGNAGVAGQEHVIDAANQALSILPLLAGSGIDLSQIQSLLGQLQPPAPVESETEPEPDGG